MGKFKVEEEGTFSKRTWSDNYVPHTTDNNYNWIKYFKTQ